MIWPDPTHQPAHQPTHPPTPTHQIIHQPLGGGVSTDFKSSNRIEISWLVQVLLNFDWFQGPPWGWGWVDGVWGGERVLPTHMHTHMHTLTHACTCTYDIIGNSHGFPQWGRPFASNYHVYHTCMCMHVRVCMHVCVHMWWHPSTTPHPHPQEPQGAWNTKIQ